MKPKLIVVAYHMGRIGSSAVMGTLVKLGAYVGEEESLCSPAKMNPKGFFELLLQRDFMNEVYRGIYPGFTLPPTINIIEEIAKQQYLQYSSILKSTLGGKGVIAVKSQRMLTLPLLHKMLDEYDIKMIVLDRDYGKQAKSLRRVWKKNNINLSVSHDETIEWLLKWKKFSEEILGVYEFDRVNLSFESVISNPYDAMLTISSFIGVDSVSEVEVSNWIDGSLVNRDAL